ncbi:hypothetical protein [Pedobacter ureilyticus]|jgi:ribosomal protein L27|uniref:DUF4294 domain-containing protein n=1 Tax=Pedobacter ureilyticus TaxID=1393051 RepID=A0ABW9JAY5_9SPHI|nr:hypothetical protein [Pedobacter helvus]
MCNIRLFIVLISFSIFGLFGQDPTDPVIAFKLPPAAKKITWAEYKKEKAKYTVKRVPLDFKSLYQVGGILIGIEEGKFPLSYPVTLERIQEAGVELLRKKETMISNEIVKINNIRILIRKTQAVDAYNYHFYSDFKNFSNVSGIVEFKKKDKQQGDLIFDQIVKSIRMN